MFFLSATTVITIYYYEMQSLNDDVTKMILIHYYNTYVPKHMLLIQHRHRFQMLGAAAKWQPTQFPNPGPGINIQSYYVGQESPPVP